MNANVIRAIFRRNFVSYFSNPTGYVFICVFVLLSSFAAFWPPDFFNANLANLNELNKYLPYIMLVFIPAITMSIWAEERRQGTDELLLTIPATDFDVVLGKYLAAVAIFTVALVFSLVSNLLVLFSLGEPDVGLLLGTYFGYWMVGLAMLAIGMVASFLTGNLTVGFILGAVFNAPLAFAASADVIVQTPELAMAIKRWSITEQFRDFSRGVISLSAVAYFFAIVALMLYLSMVLIGRRHWGGGRRGEGLVWHYAVRIVALMVAVGGATMFLTHHDRLRADVTTASLSSLSPQTRKLIQNLDMKYPVKIEAYVSPQVPESYVPTRLNLLSTLSELQALSPDKIQVEIHNVEPFSQEATRAEQQYDIKPQQVESRSRGARKQEDIFLGVAFSCGTDRVRVPFLGKGIPVEYELVRSIVTVSQQRRKKIGVLTTDAKLFGGFDMQTMASSGNQLIIEELQKQYDVVQVDPTNAITDKYDVLLAVQPSSLAPPQMDHFIAAVKGGQPTAIFEDPFPYFASDVPGTAAPKQPPGGANPFMGRQPPQPKGDIGQLWKVLGVDFMGDRVVWQAYNPYPKVGDFISPEWVFINSAISQEPFNEEASISSKLQQLLFLFPGSVRGLNNSSMKFTRLVSTGTGTGTIPYDQILERSFMGPSRINPELHLLRERTGEEYVVAAQVTGKLDSDASSDKAPEKGAAKAPGAKPAQVNVVIVSDIDCLYPAFFALRARGEETEDEVDWDFDNVPFVLNVLDALAGEDRFTEIRKRRPEHRTLTKVTEATTRAREAADEAREKFNNEYKGGAAAAQKKFESQISALKKRTGMNAQQALIEVLQAQTAGQRELEVLRTRLKDKRDREVKRIENELTQEILQVQDSYKLRAVILPPIPPLLLAGFVFFSRRAREREGVAKSRLR